MNENNFHKRQTQPPAEASRDFFPAELPQSISGYKVESLLEKGGMSHVYLGVHPQTHEPVTIKVLSPKFLSNPEIAQRFLKEAKIIGMADHPNIVKLFSQGEWEGGLYIAMEFIEGISLKKYLQRTPLSLKKALEIILQIAYALCHLHSHGVIHRDLKLENILVTKAGAIKVIDFGIAQLLHDRRSGKSLQKRIIGTPVYMSPEQKDNPESVSYPSDIYSLGIIAYELILGKLSQGKIHLSLMPKGLQPILAKCLQSNPAHRYQDIVAFITDLSDYLNSKQLNEDKKETDRLSQISEELQKSRDSLSTIRIARSENYNLGMSIHHGMNSGGLYIDSLPTENSSTAIVVAESINRGISGLTANASIKGQIRAFHTKLSQIEKILPMYNDFLINDPSKPLLKLSCLSLFPNDKKFRFTDFSYGSLWHTELQGEQTSAVDCSNPMLGEVHSESVNKAEKQWQSGERLVYVNLMAGELEGLSSLEWTNSVAKTSNLPPKKQSETLIRKLKNCITCEDLSIIVISCSLQ
jgi:eukaryotic-like serine/threonine-protein kinase